MTAHHTTQSRFAENNQRMAKPALVPLSQEEQKLTSEVTKRITNCLNQATIERCDPCILSWCEQIQKVSLSCRDSNCSRTRFWTWKWKFHPCIFHWESVQFSWQRPIYQLRKDDVWIVTSPKCGTTWTQVFMMEDTKESRRYQIINLRSKRVLEQSPEGSSDHGLQS